MPSSLHNTWLIAKREYLERVRTKAFLIATVLIPILMGGFVFASGYLGTKTKSIAHVAVVSADPQFTADLKSLLETGKRSHMTVDTYTPSPATRTALDEDLKNKNGITGYLWVTPSPAAGKRPAFAYVARSAGDATTVNILNNSIQTALTREELTRTGVASKDIDNLLAPVDIDTSATGNSKAAYSAALVLFLLMYMVIMLYGMNTARSIIEEKTSRVFEVLLATIRPDEMLAGKMIGVGSVGITQVGVWMITALAIGTFFLMRLPAGAHPIISLTQIFFFIAFFLFGFLLYSSIAAALGAMTNSEQELQQLNLFLVLPLASCMLMLVPIIKDPDSTLSRVVSLIPFCSPLLMNFRVSIGNPRPWEIWLSFLLMGVTICTILWVASRIYRVGILMYGKKPNLPEILRWLKYS
jgi:ABC-2 type transport system permease protein